MTTTAGLLAFAALLAILGPRLVGTAWTTGAPRLGIVAWQAASVGVVLASVLAGLTLLIPATVISQGLAAVLDACATTVAGAYTSPSRLAAILLAALLGGFLPLRLATVAAGSWLRDAAARRRLRASILATARPRPALGALLVDSDRAAAFCVPGRRPVVVLTTASLETLSGDELAAVLAHERAHLRGRHHLAVGAARVLSRAFPGVPLFARAGVEIERLLELVADDAAGRQVDRLEVASALVTLAGMEAPRTALAAAQGAGAVRVNRLLRPVQRIRPVHRAAAATGALMVVRHPWLWPRGRWCRRSPAVCASFPGPIGPERAGVTMEASGQPGPPGESMSPVSSAPSARPSRLPARAQRGRSRRRWALLGAATAVLLVVAGCSTGVAGDGDGNAHDEDVALEHVHGLGVDPADGALYAGTHHGLVRISGGGELTRIADRVQDFMGFTVVGPEHYLASGHPGPGQSGPGNLGLIETTDGGQSWTTLSLEGEADFHALDAADDIVYGYSGGRLLVSDDGVNWTDRGGLRIADLAVDPSSPDRLLATSEQGLILSEDGGKTFRVLAGGPRLLLVDFSADAASAVGISPEGAVHASSDGGRTWEERGDVGGSPAALAVDARDVYVAVDGAIVASADGGETFSDFYRGD